ncbi:MULTISPECIES: alpha/beta hydrolase [Streptomyces]|uniref:alpha/beta hydrolase n=1 Tax=Streptomyces TaxID=1883 RepID=UPI0009A0D4E2|nr:MULTISPECIES: alpha/beta fold hydrolase [Streptomyces]MBX9421504.1 alpha/beta fold hydrolase [Streptomyces lateritius]
MDRTQRDLPADDGGTPSPAPARRRRQGLLATALATLAVPVVPLYATVLSYLVYHPPRRPHHRSPEQFGLPSREVWVPLDDKPVGKGRSLHVWLCPGSTDRVVVIGHGIGLSKSASLAQAKFLHEAGYTVALFDHRNHGRSATDRAFWGLSARHTDDVAAVVGHLRREAGYADARIAVFGFSFSTFPSLYLLRRPDCGVDAIVCDSGPALELPPLFRNFILVKGIPVPAPLRTEPALGVLSRVFGTVGTAMLQAQWPPPAEGAYLRTPVLMLAGDGDSVIPLDGVRALAGLYPAAEVRVLPDTEHLQGMKTAPDEYRAAVLDFLKRTLG